MEKAHGGKSRNFWSGTSYSRVTPQPPTEARQPQPSSPGLIQRFGESLLSFVIMIVGLALLPFIWTVALVAAVIDDTYRRAKRRFRRTKPPELRIVQPLAESEQARKK